MKHIIRICIGTFLILFAATLDVAFMVKGNIVPAFIASFVLAFLFVLTLREFKS